jgi:hypothetical protein
MKVIHQNKSLKLLFLGILVVLVAWQGVQFIRFSADQIPAVWTWIGKPAQWRSAAYSASETFADYVALANEVIPTDAKVATSAEDYASWQFSHMTYLQYHLFPREITLCSDTGCLISAAENGNYALIPDIGHFFNNPQTDHLHGQVIEFNHKWGILSPETSSQSPSSPLESFSSIKQIATHLVLPGLWILAVGLPGLLLSSVILPEWRWTSRFFLGTTLGLGIVSFLTYIFLLFTQNLSTGVILLSIIFWWLIAILLTFTLSKQTNRNIFELNLKFKISLLEIMILSIGFVVAFISLGKSYWGTDGIILWANKGYGIAAFGLSEGLANWGSWAAHYPLQNPILIAIFRFIFGDLVPESKIFPAIFYIALPLAASEFFRTRTNQKYYSLPILLWMLSPFVIRQGTIGYANLSFTYYLLSAAILAVHTMTQGQKSPQSTSRLFLSGVMFAIAAWNRPEGTALCLILLAILLIWKKDIKSYWMVFLPMVIYITIWGFTKDIAYLNPSGSEGFLLDGVINVIGGNIIWADAGYLSKSFFQATLSIEAWGFLIWVLLIGLVFLLLKRKSPADVNVLVFAGVMTTLAALAVIYLKVYNPAKCDVSCMVNTAMERLIMPGVGLIWAGVSSHLLSLLQKEPTKR